MMCRNCWSLVASTASLLGNTTELYLWFGWQKRLYHKADVVLIKRLVTLQGNCKIQFKAFICSLVIHRDGIHQGSYTIITTWHLRGGLEGSLLQFVPKWEKLKSHSVLWCTIILRSGVITVLYHFRWLENISDPLTPELGVCARGGGVYVYECMCVGVCLCEASLQVVVGVGGPDYPLQSCPSVWKGTHAPTHTLWPLPLRWWMWGSCSPQPQGANLYGDPDSPFSPGKRGDWSRDRAVSRDKDGRGRWRSGPRDQVSVEFLCESASVDPHEPLSWRVFYHPHDNLTATSWLESH